MARSATVCLAVLFALFEIGACIRCYQCNTQSDKTCGDPFKASSKSIDCKSVESVDYNKLYLYNVLPSDVFGAIPGAPRYCHKIVMESGSILRSCLDGNPADINHTCRVMEKASQLAPLDRKIKSCSVCDKDNCNAAGSLTFSLPLSVVALLASYMLYKQ